MWCYLIVLICIMWFLVELCGVEWKRVELICVALSEIMLIGIMWDGVECLCGLLLCGIDSFYVGCIYVVVISVFMWSSIMLC